MDTLLNQLIKADKENKEKLNELRKQLDKTIASVDEQCKQIISAREMDALKTVAKLQRDKSLREDAETAAGQESTRKKINSLDEKEKQMHDTWVSDMFTAITSVDDE